MATVASLTKEIAELREFIAAQVTNLNDQMADIEERFDKIEAAEPSGDRRATRGRRMTDEQKAEAGRRMQQARAEKLGLDTIEQLRALHLRPGTKPTKAQLEQVKKEFPAEKSAKASKTKKS